MGSNITQSFFSLPLTTASSTLPLHNIFKHVKTIINRSNKKELISNLHLKSLEEHKTISASQQVFRKIDHEFHNHHSDKSLQNMVYTYTPTYYSSLHDSITTLCKNILPFSKKKRLTANERKLSKLQSDNLKWQQDSFHQILNLMGLEKEGIVSENEVSAFRSHMIDTLIVSPVDIEQPTILRDKLLFLRELLYAKCISEHEYHSSKRPLLQRLAVQGAEVEVKDIIAAKKEENYEEEWSVIDLRDETSTVKDGSNSKSKSKHGLGMKQIKGAASVLSFKSGRNKENSNPHSAAPAPKNEFNNPFWDKRLSNGNAKGRESKSILMMSESSSKVDSVKELSSAEKLRKKPFRSLLLKEQREQGNGDGHDYENSETKSAKKQWSFWKRSNNAEDETSPLPLFEKSDSEAFCTDSCKLVCSPIGEGPDTKQIKRKLLPDGSSSDFFIDKVLGDRIKKELSRIQSELSTTNSSLQFSNDQMESISTRLPVDKADLKKFFPKTWCDRYGDVVLGVVEKEFKEHVGEMENRRDVAREKHSSRPWTTFDDDENCHPNLFSPKEKKKGYETNPFLQEEEDYNGKKLRHESEFFQDHNTNPFGTPIH